MPPLRSNQFRRALFLAVCALGLADPGRAQMKAHFINVQQGDAILLEFKSAAVLIDAGGQNTGDTSGQDHLIGYLDNFFNQRPDLNRTLYSVIVSHPHIDHTRHLMAVLNRYRVQNLVDGGGHSGVGIQPVIAARDFASQHGIIYNRIRDSQIASTGYAPWMLRSLGSSPSDVRIRFLAGHRAACQDQNNNSLVMLVTYREASFLFSGDAEADPESCQPLINRLVQRFGHTLLDVDVYKVGHHGSHNGTTSAYLAAMSPEIAVISAGHPDVADVEGFDALHHGHPREQAVASIEQAVSGTRAPVMVKTLDGQLHVHPNRQINKAIYCTCWDGDVVVSVDAAGQQFSVTTKP